MRPPAQHRERKTWRCIASAMYLWGIPFLVYAQNCYPLDKESRKLCNPLGITSIPVMIGFFLTTLVPLAGVVALLIFIIAAIKWIISAGDSEKVKEGKDTAVWALIGAVVILGSYIALNFIFKVITDSSRYNL